MDKLVSLLQAIGIVTVGFALWFTIVFLSAAFIPILLVGLIFAALEYENSRGN